MRKASGLAARREAPPSMTPPTINTRKASFNGRAGTYNTIVVQPTITNAGGLFGQGGKAEVYFSDDASRTLVKLKSNVPVIGSLALTLRDAVKP